MAGPARLSVALVVLALGLAPSGHALASAATTLDDQVRAIAARLRCPVCTNESVADSPSELAAQMRTLIRTKLEQGESPDAVVAYFVSRYGEWILLDPPRRGLGWLLWMAPAVLLLMGLGIALAFLRRSVRTGASPKPEVPAAPR